MADLDLQLCTSLSLVKAQDKDMFQCLYVWSHI